MNANAECNAVEGARSAAQTATLRLIYRDLVAERDRLRDAQRAVTSQLGPLPASSALVIAILAGLHPGHYTETARLLFGIGLLPFIAAVVVSVWATRPAPYRRLCAEILAELGDDGPKPTDDERHWLEKAIRLEKRILSDGPAQAAKKRFPKAPVFSLEETYERQRHLLQVVQTIVATQVVYLVIASLLLR